MGLPLPGTQVEMVPLLVAPASRALTFKHGDAVSAPGYGPLYVERVGMLVGGRPDGTVLCRLRDDPRRQLWFAATALAPGPA